jgi:hypothetical protein
LPISSPLLSLLPVGVWSFFQVDLIFYVKTVKHRTVLEYNRERVGVCGGFSADRV